MCILFPTPIFMYNIRVAAFKSLPLTCSCPVTCCVFSMLCVKIGEGLAGILSVGLSSNMSNLVWWDLCGCWNINLSAVAYRQLYFLLKSSTACCTCCNNNIALKQEVTLIYAGVHRCWDFFFTEVGKELKQPSQHLLFLLSVPAEELGTASWRFQGNSLFT